MSWVRGVGRRWPAMISAVFSVLGIAKFVASEQHVWAWVAIGALVALVLSLAMELHHTHRALIEANARPSALERAIREGHELLDGGSVWATAALAWQNATVARLREHIGEPAAHGLLYPPASEGGVAGRVRAQVTFLEGLLEHQ
jgi:hypothetical protein